MTFSEYIRLFSYREYLSYCKENYLVPQIDVDIKAPKLCALVKPALDHEPKTQYN
jgi:hypothetical protein